jgi:hypothetical protein
MTQPAHVPPRIVNDTALVQQPASPFAGSSLVPMLVSGIVLVLVGMIAAAMLV